MNDKISPVDCCMIDVTGLPASEQMYDDLMSCRLVEIGNQGWGITAATPKVRTVFQGLVRSYVC